MANTLNIKEKDFKYRGLDLILRTSETDRMYADDFVNRVDSMYKLYVVIQGTKCEVRCTVYGNDYIFTLVQPTSLSNNWLYLSHGFNLDTGNTLPMPYKPKCGGKTIPVNMKIAARYLDWLNETMEKCADWEAQVHRGVEGELTSIIQMTLPVVEAS